MAHMMQDKKVKDGAATFVLARRIGDAFLKRDVPLVDIRETLAAAIVD